MTQTPLPPYDPALPETNFGFSYEYGVDIFLPASCEEEAKWQPIRRITAVDPSAPPITTEAATYDDKGSPNAPKIGESWALNFQVQVQRHPVTGLYLPEVERMMDLADPEAVGNLAIGEFRWYDKPRAGEPNPDDAYSGRGTLQISRGQTGNDGVGQWTVSITGLGARTRITNPFTSWVGAEPSDPEA